MPFSTNNVAFYDFPPKSVPQSYQRKLRTEGGWVPKINFETCSEATKIEKLLTIEPSYCIKSNRYRVSTRHYAIRHTWLLQRSHCNTHNCTTNLLTNANDDLLFSCLVHCSSLRSPCIYLTNKLKEKIICPQQTTIRKPPKRQQACEWLLSTQPFPHASCQKTARQRST